MEVDTFWSLKLNNLFMSNYLVDICYDGRCEAIFDTGTSTISLDTQIY